MLCFAGVKVQTRIREEETTTKEVMEAIQDRLQMATPMATTTATPTCI
jgi:hypothetical protein